jgi:putative peptidoglycan lipid II flippase
LGIFGPALGVVIGAFTHFVIQLPLAKKLGFRYSLNVDTHHPGVKEIFTLMGPRTFAVSVNQIQLFAMVFFATHLGTNSLTIVTLAQYLMAFPIRIFGAPIGQASLPFLSKESNDQNDKKFAHLLMSSLNQIAFFALPASVLLLILRIPIVRLAYGAKEFPWPATLLTGRVVAILSLSVAAQAMTHVLMRAFYAKHDTRAPLYASLCSVATFLGVSYWSVFQSNWGLIGVATAISLAAWIEIVVLVLFLQKKVPFLSASSLVPIGKMLLASFLMAVSLWLPFRTLDQLIFDTTRTVELLGLTISVTTIGMLTYLFFASLLNIEELVLIKKAAKFLALWKKPLSQSPEVIKTAGQSEESTV